MEHECKHEIDLALMSERIGQILSGQNDIKKTLDKFDTTLNGNGKEGLKTGISRNGDAIKRQWWVLGIILGGLVGLAYKSLL